MYYIKSMEKAQTEEAVKVAYIKHYKWNQSIQDAVDLRVGNVLFEFKYDVDCSDVNKRAKVFAQAMHYVERIRLGIINSDLPTAIAICDKNEASLAMMDGLYDLLGNSEVDWMRTPSSPCPKLIELLVPCIKGIAVYSIESLDDVTSFGEAVKYVNDNVKRRGKPVTPSTFETAYSGYLAELGDYLTIENPHLVFLSDLSLQYRFIENEDKLTVWITDETGQLKQVTINVPSDKYLGFWSKWERPPDATDLEKIMSSADRLKDMSYRRITGAFFTPLSWVNLAHKTMDELLTPDWKSKKIYDPAAGTGNLLYPLGCSDNLFCSTLDAPDIDYIKKAAIVPEDNCWQEDYLSDVKHVVEIDPDIVIMNPPYGECGVGGANGAGKVGIADTVIGQEFKSRELFAQFMYRVKRDHPKATVCLFSTLKFMASPSYKKFREMWKMKLLGGFIFPGECFQGVKGKFPIAFTVWEAADNYEATVPLRIYDKQMNEIGRKSIIAISEELTDWIKLPKTQKIECLPLKSAISVFDGKFPIEKAHPALGYIATTANDVQHVAITQCLSTPYGNKGLVATPVTPTNFRQACVMWAVRKLVPQTWINDRDQYTCPNRRLPKEWVADCVAFCLIHGSNQTSSLRKIMYKNKAWDVKNEWVVPTIAELKSYTCSNLKLRSYLRAAKDDSFVSKKLAELLPLMSDEGRACVQAIKDVWQEFFKQAHLLDLDAVKISDYDAGWWQIKNALMQRDRGKEVLDAAAEARRKLQAKLLPGVYEYGFLPLAQMID